MDPVVALESTVIAHGLPYPKNVETAMAMEQAIMAERAEPRTIGILSGRMVVGLNEDEIHHIARAEGVPKVSLRDLPVVVARGLDGATTVSATVHIAQRAGIGVMATGGIGGVHRSAAAEGAAGIDVSADLEEIARSPVTVVCSGPKAILDLPATREYLETRGVTLIGYQTDEMPAFYSRSSGFPVDVRCDSPEEVAEIVRARRKVGLAGGCLVCVPIPRAHEIPADELVPVVEEALNKARSAGIRAAELTPFLLDHVRTLTQGRSVEANQALLTHNATVAGRIARVLFGQTLRA